MPPMDINDWWLAAAAAAASGMLAPSAGAASQPGGQVGVVTAVRPGVVSATNERVVYIGNAVAYGERFKTDSTGTIHILFMDQSSMTLGPNSELVIDEFAFHPDTQRGNIAVNLLKGALRVVGGFISKYNNPQGRSSAQVRTATATIGIRGGISMVTQSEESTEGVFLFGDLMEMYSPDGSIHKTVTRPGFFIRARGNTISDPARFSPNEMGALMRQFDNRQNTQPGGSGGNLISTNDRPGSLNTPNSTLAPDRMQHVTRNIESNTPANSLRTIMGSDSSQVQS